MNQGSSERTSSLTRLHGSVPVGKKTGGNQQKGKEEPMMIGVSKAWGGTKNQTKKGMTRNRTGKIAGAGTMCGKKGINYGGRDAAHDKTRTN